MIDNKIIILHYWLVYKVTFQHFSSDFNDNSQTLDLL
jgi:hypothetical protein